MSMLLFLNVKLLSEVIVESLMKVTTAFAFPCKSNPRNFNRNTMFVIGEK